MQNFFQRLFQPAPDEEKIAQLYGRIMAAARAPVFFTAPDFAGYGLPDEFETRFELLVLHMFLALTRLQALGGEGQALARGLTDAMVADLDRTLREMGVGDVGVVKRMKHFMEAYYGRMNAYARALASADEKDILRALDKNLYGAISTDLTRLKMMHAYIFSQQSRLKNFSLDDFLETRELFVSA